MMGKIILSAFADEYSDCFAEQLGFLQRSDIGFIEIRGVDGKNISALSSDEVKNCKKMLDDSGIHVSSIGSPLGKIPIDGDIEAHLETAKRVFETACTLETSLCRVFSFYIPEGKDPYEYSDAVKKELGRLIELAESFGVTLCLENEWRIYGQSPERAKELTDYFGTRLKCVFDMGNFVLDGHKPYPDGYELLKDSIEYFHIKDALTAGAIVPAGRGDAFIKEILAEHTEYSEKDFFVSLEPHLQTFGGFNQLTDRDFDNPYKFETRQAAFEEALRSFRELLK